MPRRTLAAFDLKAARKMRGLSQAATAEIICATQPSVARWELQGNLPEVFRKVWNLHWQLEDMKGGKKSAVRSSVRKVNLSNVQTGNKEPANDKASDRDVRKPRPRGRTARTRKEGIKQRNEGLQESQKDGESSLPESDISNG